MGITIARAFRALVGSAQFGCLTMQMGPSKAPDVANKWQCPAEVSEARFRGGEAKVRDDAAIGDGGAQKKVDWGLVGVLDLLGAMVDRSGWPTFCRFACVVADLLENWATGRPRSSRSPVFGY